MSSLPAGDTFTAALNGRVTDQSGAVVPGARIEVVESATRAVRVASTGRDGEFFVRGLAPGRYLVSADSPGFGPYLRSELALAAGVAAALEIVLRIPVLGGQISVTAKAPAGEGAFESRPENSREILEIREVRESAAKDVGEALTALEGLWKVRKGGIANDVVLRGFQQGNVNVLLDGVRINGACPNHMDPAAFHADFAEIESVQVTKGPFDVRNEGSVAGTISVVSKKPPDGLGLSSNLSSGSFGFFNPSLQASYWKNRVYVLAGYSYRIGDPYTDGAGRRFTDYANYTPAGSQHRAFDINTGWMRLGIVPASNQSLEVAYTRQAGGLTLYPYLQMDALYDNADRLRASWEVRDLPGKIKRVRAEGAFARVKHWMTDELRVTSAGAALGFGMATFAGTRTISGRVEAEFADTIAGVEGYQRGWNAVNTMRMAGVYSSQASMPDVRMLVGGAYVQHRRDFGRLQMTAGARLDGADSAARSANLDTSLYWAYHGTRSTSRSDWKPSGTLWLTYALPGGVEVFGGAGTTARVPDAQERYYALRRSGTDWTGNPDLPSARNREADAGITVRSGRVTLRPTVFYSLVDDFIALRSQPILNPTPGVMNKAARSYENVNARVYGGEFSYSVALSRAVLLAGGVSYVRGIQYAKPEAGMAGGNIAEMPPQKSRLSLRYGNRFWFLEGESRVSAAQDNLDTTLREQRTPGYAVFGIRGGIHHRRLNLAAGLDNLFDRYYCEHLSFQRDPFRTGVRVPEPGRAAFVNVSFVLD